MIVNDMVESDLIEVEKDNDSEDEDENKFFINIKIFHVVKDMFINVMEKLVNHQVNVIVKFLMIVKKKININKKNDKNNNHFIIYKTKINNKNIY